MSDRGKPKATILVIDDEQIVHESVRRILEEEGYRVDGTLRVDQALEKLANQSYDIVLTDLMMPERNGMEAVEAVAKDHPATGVIVFTGFATVDTAVQSMKIGALDYLPKPFTPDELIQVTARALEKTLKARRDREIEKTYSEAEKALTSSLDLKEILGLICESVVRLFNVKGAALTMIRKKDESLEFAASAGLSDEYVKKGVLASSRSIPDVYKSGDPVYVDESEFDSVLQYPAEARREKIAGILSIPLKLHETILGFLRIYSSEKRQFDREEMDLLLKFAEQAARALENAMAYERVRTDIEGMKKYIPAPISKKIGLS
ncbi:MAG TPA: response regulator [Desulfomonilaceae bacterium]|nr:response regulator [Desulfomonilaceae bacterium]